MRNKKTTIHDIAKKLNVTASTVSRALQDHPRISDSTKESVKKMANKLNYQPNNIAAALRSGKSNIIGIIIPRIDRNFFASIIKGVERVLDIADYKLIISQSNESTSKEKSNINALLKARVDGIFASYALNTKNFNHYKEVISNGVPLILFDRLHKSLDHLPIGTVAINDYSGAFQATEHLIGQGCRKIIHFSGPQHVSIYKERRRGYEEALKHHNIPVDERLITENNLGISDGRKLGKEISTQKNMADAIFSASDFCAAGAMKVLKAHNISVPDDIAIAGFSNDPFTSFINMTTVDQHAEQIGDVAAQIFLDQLQAKDNQQVPKRVLPPELIVRDSSLRKEPT